MPEPREFPLLEFSGVDTHYGDLHVLKAVDYRIEEGEIVCLLGGNASGKSTTMKTIMGVVVPTAGEVRFDGKSLAGVSVAERVRRGIAPVLEARRLFPRMTVYENLEMGAYTRPRGPEFAQDLERVFTLFPRVKERLKQLAGTLSGGEQQMVAIGRALMAHPRLLCMDEPSMGLAPVFVEQVFDIIQTINRQGTTIFMVEQNANMALQIAHRAYVLQTGQVVLSGAGRRAAPEPDDPRSLSRRDEGGVRVAGATQSAARRSRSALLMTVTELTLIAALAIIGLSSKPKAG